jgi:hypothetical protein
MQCIGDEPMIESGAAKPAHMIVRDPHGEFGPTAWCICGWRKNHPREKVREAAIVRHLARVSSEDAR